MKKVEIPLELIKKLEPFGPRFLKVAKPVNGDRNSGKQAIEDGWVEKLYEAHDPELQRWLQTGGNYGYCAGKGIVEVDLDDPRMQRRFEDHVNAFTTQSGGGTGRHYTVTSDVTFNGTLLDVAEKRKNLGNIQGHNKYIVGPGSNHWTGGEYKIINDAPFTWVSKKDFEEIFGDYLKWSKIEESEATAKEEKTELDKLGVDIPLQEIIPDFDKLRRASQEEYQGSHPIHGSTTGQNFCVNVVKNVWHCFRCNSGGGPLSWLAVKHGLIECDQAQKGILRGELWRKVVEVAKKEGYELQIKEWTEKITGGASKYFKGKPPQFIPALLAKDIMEKFTFITRDTDQTVFFYDPNTGTYSYKGEPLIMRVVKKTLKNSFRRNRLAEVIADIKASTIKEIPETPTHLIAVQNGILNLKTMKLESFSSDYFILNPLPVKYDPKANCPKIKKFVSEIVPPENVLVLQEASGYCLHRDIPIHRTFLFLGEGANGKSTFMELLRTFLGKGNVCSIPLQDFEKDKFATAQLYGKLANIYPDLSVEDLKNTGVFKTTSGGDTISAQFKFKDMFDFKPYAKQLYSANKPPKTFDQSYAFWRRWITVNFPNQFRDDDPKTDKNLLQKLTTPEELSGFLNWALEGLRRLLENAKFSTTMSEEETQEQWTAAVDVIKAFIEEGYLEWCSGEFTTKDECYEEFLAFCQRNKLPRECERVFKNRITKEFPMCKEMQKNVGNRILRGWADLKLNKFNSKNRINTWSTTATDLRENYNSNRQPVEAVSPVETHSTGKTLEDFKDVAKS